MKVAGISFCSWLCLVAASGLTTQVAEAQSPDQERGATAKVEAENTIGRQPNAARASASDQLLRMLAKYPDADTDGDGMLTEGEAGNFILRRIQRKRPNRGAGIRDRALIDVYEARTYKTIPYRLMKPIKIEPGRRYPLVVSLHGSGGIGDDNLSNLRFWNGVMAQRAWREKYASFVLVPQRKPGGYWGSKPDDERFADLYVRNDLLPVFDLIDEMKQLFPIDESRIYVIGSSGGGVGTWNFLRSRPGLPAAAIPVCGRFPAAGNDVTKLASVPIWCFHGDADQLVDVENSRRAFAELTAAGGRIKYTELPGVKHNAWIQAFTYERDDESKDYVTRYSSDRCDRTADVWQWLFRQRRPQSSAKPSRNRTIAISGRDRDDALAQLPDIQTFASNKSDRFLVDLDVVRTGHPYRGTNAERPHTGGHVYFSLPETPAPPGNLEGLPAIYAVADGVVSRIDYSFRLREMFEPALDRRVANYRYGIGLTFATMKGHPVTFHYSIEPFVDPGDENFYDQFILVKPGQHVKKGDIIARMYIPENRALASKSHIHFNLIGEHDHRFMAPAIFSEEITRRFHSTWRRFGRGNDAHIPPCQGYKLAPHENPFGTGAQEKL